MLQFFSSTPLCDELDGFSLEECKEQLSHLTFSNFIKCKAVQDFIFNSTEQPRLPAMRYVYLYYLFQRVGDYIGDTKVLALFENATHTNKNQILNLKEIYTVCENMDHHTQAGICLAIESITRGQHNNMLWHVLRDGIISSSKFYQSVNNQVISRKLFCPWPIDNNYYVASPLAFGLRCEDVMKTIMAQLICYKKSTTSFEFGFMQSPKDCIFGVSVDMCTNVTTDNDDLLVFRADSEIYEIKCRYKYLFSKSECDATYLKYNKLYMNPCKGTFIDFINSVSKPGVEYVPYGKLPSKSDFLITSDTAWEGKAKRKRNLTCIHKTIAEGLKANRFIESDVYLLTDPSETEGKIDIKARLSIPMFANPDHSYFYQVLLQYKVVTNYIQYHSKGGLGTLKNYLVSGFFRKRNHCDPATCTIGESGLLDSSVEIPVLVIVTQVVIPHSIVQDSLVKAANFWCSSAQEEFEQAPWVSSSLFADGDITP
ncbi:deoxyribonuclease [Harp seal herpesvirus]|uniref:Deoxyribonuclease n=1 Tax=phocid gammaherpesvirus 3 TaxID=2560643 RepID=A0A0R5WUP4_9GAMA|nr:deoxyribonuclease [Harp seal herpesvirus]AJG42962.1 deoxyribonuclease [Harp seal herpesvirus]